MQIPGAPLEEYQACLFQPWRAGVLAYTALSVLYGALCLTIHRSRGIDQPPFIEDCSAFLLIVYAARKWGLARASGLPALLSSIVRGATIYFLVVFAGQLLLIFFEIFAPVSDLLTDLFSSAHNGACRDRPERTQGGKSPPSTISVRLNLTICLPYT